MSFMIREDFTKDNSVDVIWNYQKPLEIKESYDKVVTPIIENSLMTEYEALHSGITRNFTDYTENAILSSLKSWTTPYLKPIIMHHNEEDGTIIGRVHEATCKKIKTLSGTPTLYLVGNVPDEKGMKAIKDGRLKTVSVGVIAHEAYCSICGQNIADEGPCEHERGVYYDDVLCTWRIERMEAKEISYVIVPSDSYAQQVNFYKPKLNNNKQLKESYKGVLKLDKQLDVKEGQTLEETVPEVTPIVTNKDNKKYEEEIKILKDEKDLLIETNKKLTKELEAEKTLKTAVEKKLADTQVLLQKANEDIENVKKDLVVKEAAISREKELRENLEKEIIENKKAKHVALAESVLDARKKLNKREISLEDLTKRSDEFLQESLEDLNEELNLQESLQTSVSLKEQQEKVQNPGFGEELKENIQKPVKEEKPFGNMNLEESLTNVFSAFLDTRKC